jgi:hypothetical protein
LLAKQARDDILLFPTARCGGRVEFEIEFRYGDGPADIEITLSGAPTPDTFVKLNKRLTEDPKFRSGMTILADLAALDASELPVGEVQSLAELVVERDWYRMPSAVAIIAPDQQTFDAALLFRAHLGGSKSNRRVFRSRVEAIAWLEEQRGIAAG